MYHQRITKHLAFSNTEMAFFGFFWQKKLHFPQKSDKHFGDTFLQRMSLHMK
jgi:hypothetical protein